MDSCISPPLSFSSSFSGLVSAAMAGRPRFLCNLQRRKPPSLHRVPRLTRSPNCVHWRPISDAAMKASATRCRWARALAVVPKATCPGRRRTRTAAHCVHWPSAMRPSAGRRTRHRGASAPAASPPTPARYAGQARANWGRPASRSAKRPARHYSLSRISFACCRAVILLCHAKRSAAFHAAVMK
jgi:hypothetical protein